MWDVFIKLVDLWMAKLVYMLSGSDYRNNTKCVKSCDMLIVEIISYQSVKNESYEKVKVVEIWNLWKSEIDLKVCSIVKKDAKTVLHIIKQEDLWFNLRCVKCAKWMIYDGKKE